MLSGELQDRMCVTSAVLAVVFTVVVLVRPYFTWGWIPVGWDTAIHLYWARLIVDGDIQRALEVTHGFNLLPSVTIAAVSAITGLDILGARILLTVLLPLLLLVAFYWTAHDLFEDRRYAVLALVVAAVWFSTYRLSADLHRTLLAYLCLVPVFALYVRNGHSTRDVLMMAMLAAVATFAQQQVVIFFLINVGLVEGWRAIRFRTLDTRSVVKALAVTAAMLPALLLSSLYGSNVVVGAITGTVTWPPPDIRHVALTMGGPMMPFTLLGLGRGLYDVFTDPTGKLRLVETFGLSIVFLVYLPSLVITQPVVFRMMATRAMTVLPTPIFVVLGLRETMRVARGGAVTAPSILHDPRVILATATIVVVIMSGMVTQYEATVHHRPFVTQDALDQLRAVAEWTDGQLLVVVVRSHVTVTAFKDASWAGVILGEYLYYNGPLCFLAAGRAWPLGDPEQTRKGASQINDLIAKGVSFPLDNASVKVVVVEALYGRLTTLEVAIAHQVDKGAFRFAGNDLVSLTVEYELSPSDYCNYSGDWRLECDDTACIHLGRADLTGEEEIAYPVVVTTSGQYNITLQYEDFDTEYGGFNIELDGRTVASVEYGGTGTQNVTISTVLSSDSVSLLRVTPIRAGTGEIALSRVIVTRAT